MKTMTTKKKSPLTDQSKLKMLCDLVCDNIEGLFDLLQLEYKDNGKMYSMSCPIHGGDNPSAISLYPEGNSYRGNWKCRTHGCEMHFKPSILGFIRGVLSNQKYNWEKPEDQTVSFEEAVQFATEFTKQDLKNLHISKSDRNKQSFTSIMNYVKDKEVEKQQKIPRELVIKTLQIPAQYFIDREYSPGILKKYDVGLCNNPNKEMYNRVVVPIYDKDYNSMVGCSGRSIFEKCSGCNCFHNPEHSCVSKDDAWKHSKWKHSANFKTQFSLYNYWFAKEHILESLTAIIVESPGNVWRLEESGIHNSLAIYGASMTDRQKVLLDGSGAMNLVVLTDNDEAGRKAAQQIKEKCQNTYNVFIPTISKADVGEMSIEEINQEIKPLLEKLK